MTDDAGAADRLGYAAAVAELEQILAELERDDVDVDVLAPRVRRAAALIRFCRDRVASARLDVQQIVADLDEISEPDDRNGSDASDNGDGIDRTP